MFSAETIDCAILCRPAARLAPNPASTCSRYASTLLPERITRCVSFVLRSATASKYHSNRSVARSRGISIAKEWPGSTSRIHHANGSCPGSSVAPREPSVNRPSSRKVAGGSFHVVMSVRNVQANAGLTSTSIECSRTSCSSATLSTSWSTWRARRSRDSCSGRLGAQPTSGSRIGWTDSG
jgi:hypothetical protein